MSDRSIDGLVAELTLASEQAGYSGVILVHDGHRPVLELASGLANRSEQRPVAIDTRLATASGTKGFTALAAVGMIEDGLLSFGTTVREVVGDDLTLVDPMVTIEHLLGHTSGVGDYLDEERIGSVDDHVLDVPVHRLTGPEDYVPILNRHPQSYPPGARFAYNNSGYVILALIIERIAGRSYHDEVRSRVFEPAAMASTDFLRSDDLPANTALGYLENGRTNVLHLPVIGTGDGGAYTTGGDMIRFWQALFDGRIIGRSFVERMTAVHHHGPPAYGLGFWIGDDHATVQLEGMDAGVSLRSGANPDTGLASCLIANDSAGVWPLAAILDRWSSADPPG